MAKAKTQKSDKKVESFYWECPSCEKMICFTEGKQKGIKCPLCGQKV